MEDVNRIRSIMLSRLQNGKVRAEMTATGIPFGSDRYDLEFDSIRDFTVFIITHWEYTDKIEKESKDV